MKKPLYDPVTGIHRAKVWEIAFYALNNTSTNMYMLCFMYVTYYLTGIAGIGVALAGTVMTLMRIWDGITDPIIGYVVDRTNGRFGKNRPFIVLGQLFMLIGTGLIFLAGPALPENMRFVFFVLCYMFFIIGYTFQCVVTKSAQTCLTNDPGQRPVFSVFDAVFNVAVFAALPIIITSVLVPKYNVMSEDGTQILTSGLYNPQLFRTVWLICASMSLVFSVLAVIGLRRKDRSEFYGTGKAVRIKLRDYWETLRHNRPIQMLCLAACSDKLSLAMQTNAVVMVMLFGIIVGDYDTYSSFTAVTAVFTVLVPILLIMLVARGKGQRKALLVGTYGGIAGAVALFLLLLIGDPHNISFKSFNLYTAAFVLLFVIMKGMGSLSNTLVIPMTADCADYEVYRSGRYLPGLMGTLFSFIDKVTSSFSTAIIGLLLAAIGFRSEQPTQLTPYSSGIFWVTMFCFLGMPVIGWILNLVAMKHYKLTKEKMREIQAQIAEIKARDSAPAAAAEGEGK